MRLWQTDPKAVLLDGLATLPLAPLANVARAELANVVQAMAARIDAQAAGEDRETLLAASYLLMGLSHPPEFVKQLFKGVAGMTESTTYQEIINEGVVKGRVEGRVEGRVDEARSLLLQLGTKRLGPPLANVLITLAGAALPELERLIERLFETETWDELLAD